MTLKYIIKYNLNITILSTFYIFIVVTVETFKLPF